MPVSSAKLLPWCIDLVLIPGMKGFLDSPEATIQNRSVCRLKNCRNKFHFSSWRYIKCFCGFLLFYRLKSSFFYRHQKGLELFRRFVEILNRSDWV